MEHMLVYVYDEFGAPIAIQYRNTNYLEGDFDIFFLERNMFGDIIGIYNEAGERIGVYSYDAWGMVSSSYDYADEELEYLMVDEYNPFGYRGYFYDRESNLYYLQSRYYSPTKGRFINADAAEVITATPMGLTDKNLFAYCDNNPVMRTDEDGEFWNFIIGGAVGAVIGGVVAALNGGDVADVIVGGLGGAASGMVAASGLGIVAQAGISVAISGAADIANQDIDINQANGTIKDYDISQTIDEGIRGGILSAVGSGLGFVTGKYITGTSDKAAQAFDDYLGKTFSAGLRIGAGRSSSALLRQANRFLNQSVFYDNITRGVSSSLGSTLSFLNLLG